MTLRDKLYLGAVKPFWLVWAKLIIWRYGGYFGCWAYALGLWQIALDDYDVCGLMSPSAAFKIDQSYWDE